jgi:hypothetical protein
VGLSHSPVITTDGLVLCLDAANSRSYPGNGTIWSDLSGNNENFTMINGTILDSAYRGSMALDGVNDYTRSTTFFTGNYWSNNGPWSVVSFHKVDSIPLYSSSGLIGSQLHISEPSPIGGFGLMLATYNTPKRYIAYMSYDSGGTKTQYAFGSSPSAVIDLGQITCIAAVYDPDNNSGKIYKNGNLISTTINSNFNWTPRSSGRDIRIGIGAQGGWTNYWSGNIYNMMVYNKALSDNEIKQNYLATKGRFGL